MDRREVMMARPNPADRGGEVARVAAHVTARVETRVSARTWLGRLQLRGERAKACPI